MHSSKHSLIKRFFEKDKKRIYIQYLINDFCGLILIPIGLLSTWHGLSYSTENPLLYLIFGCIIFLTFCHIKRRVTSSLLDRWFYDTNEYKIQPKSHSFHDVCQSTKRGIVPFEAYEEMTDLSLEYEMYLHKYDLIIICSYIFIAFLRLYCIN